MTIWALGDLHLAFGVDKPMDVFGDHWRDHPARIRDAWSARVAPDDVVLVAGDISWGLRLDEALPDLEFVASLPGRKYLIKGNHDPWWSSRSKVERVLPAGLRLVQSDAHDLGDGVAVTGTRGWTLPGTPGYDPERDERIFRRELGRLRRGLEALDALSPRRRLVMLHYPPIWPGVLDNDVTRLLRSFLVDECVFGHLHGDDLALAFEGTLDGVRYRLVSCDHVDFTPVALDG